MTPIKNYIAEMFLNKKYRFKCDCLIPIDVTGVVKDFEISHNEIILLVLVDSKIIHIGLNSPSLQIEMA